MGRAALGLDIGHAEIKLAEVRRGGKQPVLVQTAGMAVPAGTLEEGNVVKPESLQAALGRLKDQVKTHCRKLVLGLTSADVFVRSFQLPPMPERELREALRWEVKEALRITEEELTDFVYDYEVIATGPDGELQEVVVVAVRREVVEGYLQALDRVGWYPGIVDVQIFSVAGLSTGSERICHVDIGAELTQVYVSDGNRYNLFRVLPIGGNALTRAIATGWGVSLKEAEGLKKEKDIDELLSANDPAPLTAAISDLTYRLAQTLEFIRANLRANSVRQVVSEILLSGGGALLAGLPGLLQDELDCRVRLVNPADFVETRGDEGSKLAELPKFAGSIGLALRGLAEL